MHFGPEGLPPFPLPSRLNQIVPAESMNILGFNFSSRPDISAQVEAIKKKFQTRIWILRHLYSSGFSEEVLLRVYRSVILPVHDYCSTVYPSSLTQTQTNALERLQAQALNAIFGYELGNVSKMSGSGLGSR